MPPREASGVRTVVGLRPLPVLSCQTSVDVNLGRENINVY
ncbi:hypothetical protein ARZXY2_4507 (plasmid) [Arthrobacter sp. ZXY-2]|nr:hypothetical protein ARZXY2_4507 [Arthrobacter sp. ZXY-2]